MQHWLRRCLAWLYESGWLVGRSRLSVRLLLDVNILISLILMRAVLG